METIAVYWEPIIQVYGYDTIPCASLIELDVPLYDAGLWGENIQSFAPENSGFIMFLAQYVNDEFLRFSIAIKQETVSHCLEHLQTVPNQDVHSVSFKLHRQIDILFFHGPHFQDRYGITDTVLQSLDNSDITLHGIGCTGTSVYLAVGAGEANKTKELLSKGFSVPK